MTTAVTDEDVRKLAQTAKPFSLGLLRWAPARNQDGADNTEREHQRRMVALRNSGDIAVLCPVSSDSLCGLAIFTVPPEEAIEILKDDPCVKARMMSYEVHPCHGFPGDTLPHAT
ncbi:MAG TPA: hypothetical protein VMF90_23100 [Rhizobiaceae bacterium]|nr:hypothetical protein [Rhizobiaceae bacterium]